MAKRLGIGEYERIDNGLPISSWRLREIFFKKLNSVQPEILRSVLYLTQESQSHVNDYSEDLYLAFLKARLGVKTGHFDTVSDHEDTPFQHYIRFVSLKSREIAERVTKITPKFPKRDLQRLEQIAIEELFTSSNLEAEIDARDLWKSLRAWAASHNLLDEWMLEVPLISMCHYFLTIKYDRSMDSDRMPTVDPIVGSNYFLRSVVDESVRYSLRSYAEVNTLHRLAWIKHDWDVPPFEFIAGDFKFGPVTWLPYCEKWTDFSSINETEFRRQRDPLFNNLLASLDFSVVLAEIDKIRPSFQESKRSRRGYFEIDGLIATVAPDYGLCKISKGYEFESIEQLIFEARKQFEEKLVRARDRAFDREQRLNKDFTASLKVYRKEVQESCPQDYSKTLQKQDYVHFDWLIAYQLKPGRSYTSIANSRRRQEGIKESTVRGAVSRLADALRLSLRPTSSGRPPGVKESEPRRVLGRA